MSTKQLVLQRSVPRAVAICLGLAACGGAGDGAGAGSEGTAAALPAFQSNFQQFADGGETYTSAAPALSTNGVSPQAANTTVSVRAATDGSDAILVSVDGRNYRLDYNSATGVYEGSGGDPVQLVAGLSEDAGALLLAEAASGISVHVVGQTPNDTSALTGRATYLGPLAYVFATGNPLGGGRVGAGRGGATLNADFGEGTIDGRLVFAVSGGEVQMDMARAAIGQNGFASTLGLVNGGALDGAVLTGSAIEGQFYGDAARQVAGVFSADLQIASALGQESAVLSGGYVAEKQGAVVADGETIVLGSGTVIGGSGSVYPNGASTYYNSLTDVSFGADGQGCYYVGDWSNC